MDEGVPAPTDGEFYPTDEARKLLILIIDWQNRAEAAEDKVAYLQEVVKLREADAKTLQAKIAVLQATIASLEADVKIEKAKRPSWFESHMGLCAGAYGGYSFTGSDADIGIGVLYGVKF